MARPKRPRRPKRTDGSLQELGFRATVVGLGFLIIPSLFGASPLMKVVSAGLSIPGWMLLAAGVLMLGIAYAKMKSTPASPPASQGFPSIKPAALTDRDKRELVANIFRHAPARATHPLDARFGREPVMPPEKHFGRKANDDATTPSPKPSEWSPAVFSAIEWRRLKRYAKRFLARRGLKPARRRTCRWRRRHLAVLPARRGPR